MGHDIPEFPTLGFIADRLGQPIHRVAYIVQSRGIRPVGTAGRFRVFDRAGVERIRAALAETDRGDRQGTGGGQ